MAAPSSKEPKHDYDIFGASCAEVELDALTGNFIIHRMDILYDCGTRSQMVTPGPLLSFTDDITMTSALTHRCYSPEIDVGQVEGAIVMALGLFFYEEIKYSTAGQLLTNNTGEVVMTDFSRNQITSVCMNTNQVDRWVVPNDRHLSLRAKLGTGWSVRTNRSKNYSFFDTHPHSLTEEELSHIHTIVAKAAALEQRERCRIGTLVCHYQRLQGRCLGDGTVSCYLCNTAFYRFRSNCKMCSDCASSICIECYVETVNTSNEKLILCKICSEKRELWKKSGAWFFGSIPPYTDAVDPAPAIGKTMRPVTPVVSPVSSRRSSLVEASRKNSGAAESEITSLGFGKEVMIQIIKCKPESDDDTDSDSIDSLDSYAGSLLRFRKAPDADAVSITSAHLKHNPLLSSRKIDDESDGTINGEEQEFSGTESLQDLRQISLMPMQKADQSPPGKLKIGLAPLADSSSGKGGSTPASPLTDFDGDVFRCQSLADADLKDINYHVEQDTTSPYGSIIYTIFYKELEEILVIEMLAAQHLPDTGSICNAYVSVNLVPSFGNSRKQRTPTNPHSVEPQWRHKITYFGVSLDELLEKSLTFSVIDERMLGSDFVIGEHRMPLRGVKSHELTHYHVMLEKKVSLVSDEAVLGDEKGKLQLVIRYDTSSAQLYVGVVRCVALYTLRRDGYADPYAKLYLNPDHTKTGKRKTAFKKRTLNPDFHEEFIYKVNFSSLTKRSLEVTIWDHTIPRNVFMGGVGLSMKSKVMSERQQWSDVIARPNRRHDSWHQLRDVLNK